MGVLSYLCERALVCAGKSVGGGLIGESVFVSACTGDAVCVCVLVCDTRRTLSVCVSTRESCVH